MSDIELSDVPTVLIEAWAAHQVIRTIGFSPDDIFLLVSRSAEIDGEWGVYTQLKRPDGTFTYFCGPVSIVPHALPFQAVYADGDENRILKIWEEFIERWNANAFSRTLMESIFQASRARRNAVLIATKIMEKGISRT